MRPILLCAAALCCALLSSAYAKDAVTDVATLTMKTFEEVVAKEDLVLVKFYAPWCGHCQSMAEDFSKAATALKGKAVLADVDATVEEKLASKYNIDGFPTLKLFHKGEELTDYKGNRDYDSMVKFVEGASKPAFEEVATKAEYDAFVKENTGMSVLTGVGLGADGKSQLTKSSFALRDIFPDKLAFAHVTDVKVSAVLKDLKAGDFALIKFDADGKNPKADKYVSSKDNELTLDAFVKNAAMPAFSEFTQENAELYTEMPNPIVVGFFKAEEKEGDANYKILKSVALEKEGNGKVLFAWVDVEKLESFADYIGLKGKDIPIAGYSFESDSRYMLPESLKKLDAKTFTAWVDDLIAGKLETALKSEPIPESEPESGATIVVGDSWKDVVEDEKTDVLVAQVAPWCGHCKAMKPALARAADELKKAGVKGVKICTMDATANDAPKAYKAKGFPSMHFFPAKKDAEGVEYEGERSSKDLIDFLVENAVNSFKFDTSKLGEDPTPEGEDEEDSPGEEGEEGSELTEDEIKTLTEAEANQKVEEAGMDLDEAKEEL